MVPILWGVVFLLWAGCTTGPMEIRETHYYAVPNGENTNYYRLRISAETHLGDAQYRSGSFPSSAVDSLFGDVTSDGSGRALETRLQIEDQIRSKIVETNQAWLEEAANPDAEEPRLRSLLEARRRILAYPNSTGAPFPGSYEIEYNPAKGVAIAHSDEKLVFVLSSNPDDVVGTIANFAEDEKTVYSINQLGKILAQRTQNEIASDEAVETVNQRVDELIFRQIEGTLKVLDESGNDSTQRLRAIRQIDALLSLLDSIRR